MANYRVYVVGSDGHFIDVVALECGDDAEATKRAAQLVDGHDVELWQGARKVTI
jgi:hypothetical protein